MNKLFAIQQKVNNTNPLMFFMKLTNSIKRAQKKTYKDKTFKIFHGNWKSRDASLLQILRSKLRLMGRVRLMPRTLALRAVQRQIAASRSTKPSIRLQHGVTGGVPGVKPFNKLSALTQTPTFKASLGQVPVVGVGLGFCLLCFPGGGGQLVLRVAVVRVKKRMLKRRRSARESLRAIDS
ncbi:unnamed protein product [Arabidopsis thaliana]|uniref:Transmembrane protein n=1 Tax=Arabidopsis thaliana TaxID=3702 RepID=A0A654FRR8_ARATH|nr:unnamed protein product [Arabidopsis thaliana]